MATLKGVAQARASKCPRTGYLLYALGAAGALAPTFAQALVTTGRFSFGGFASQERFSDDANGPNSRNDFQTLSGRLYLKLQQLGNFEATADLRDKHDFFDKLGAERLSLESRNDFQVRELNGRYPNPDGKFYATLGRFPLLEAGSIFVDGAELGYRIVPGLRGGTFGGHNPKRLEDAYLRNTNPDVTYGAYLNLQPETASWTKFSRASLTYAENAALGTTYRRNIYFGGLHQWSAASRLVADLYLDFLPRTYIQNGSLLYQQGFSDDFDTSAQLLAFDTIEYSRRRNVLETLPSSPYREAALTARYRLSDSLQSIAQGRLGERSADGRRREAASLGFYFPQLGSSHTELAIHGAYAREFTSAGPSLRLEANYFSEAWELGLQLEGGVQRNLAPSASERRELHPVLAEVSLANVFSRAIFSTISLQYARNEVVTILSAFLKLTYRFGSGALPPIRDGAPPRGPL